MYYYIKICLFICFLTLFPSVLASKCSEALFAEDPQPFGGANCTRDLDCGGVDGGVCDLIGTNLTGSCICPKRRGNPDCSYERYSKETPGGLNIGLPFVGIGGVGNFIIGRTGQAVGQLVLMLSGVIALFSACFIICCGKGAALVSAILYILTSMCILAGFIWSIVDGAFMLECRLRDGEGYALF